MSYRDKGVALYKSHILMRHVMDCHGLNAACQGYVISVLRLFCAEPLERITLCFDIMFGFLANVRNMIRKCSKCFSMKRCPFLRSPSGKGNAAEIPKKQSFNQNTFSSFIQFSVLNLCRLLKSRYARLRKNPVLEYLNEIFLITIVSRVNKCFFPWPCEAF